MTTTNTTTSITREEIRAWHERAAQRRAENVARAIEILGRDFPDLIIDESKIYAESYGDVIYRPDNLTYYSVSATDDWAIQLDTDLGYEINWATEHNHAYQLIDLGYYTVVVEAFTSFAVWVRFFYTNTGTRVKGRKGLRDVKKSSKGAYLTLNHKRYYLQKGVY